MFTWRVGSPGFNPKHSISHEPVRVCVTNALKVEAEEQEAQVKDRLVGKRERYHSNRNWQRDTKEPHTAGIHHCALLLWV